MADTKTSAETAASALDGTELFRGVQGGANVKVAGSQVRTYLIGAANTWTALQTYSAGIAANTLALGGATIGSNALAVTGTTFMSSLLTVNSTVQAVQLNATGNLLMLSDSGKLYFGASTDVIVARDAANSLALRNGTAAQAYRVYNTFTDSSNAEWGTINWTDTANTLTVGSKKIGTGLARITKINSASELVMQSNDGAFTGTVRILTSLFFLNNQVGMYTTDGVLQLTNSGGTGGGFNRIQFGGTTSSFPAIKRNATAINIRLADDSADASLTSASISTSATNFMHITTGTLANGEGVGVGTLTNAPASTNPTKWIPINDNGTTRYIPAW